LHFIQVNGPKTFILDPTLSTALSLLADISLLKDHGVSKIYWLEPPPVTAPTKSLFYLLRPTIPNIKLVASHVKGHHQQSNSEYTYKLVFVPRSSTLTDSVLESEGVKGSVEVVSWDMGFIPLEPDVVSLERDGTFRELWVVSVLR
jgi:vacuolar protein sorting-associated protein 33A